jgi:acetyl esterase/lipase
MRALSLPVVALAALALPAPASAAFTRHLNLSYDIDSPPATATLNQLDLYSPRGAARGSRPVVVWVHGGGWQQGDKRNQIQRKARLFTDAGYVLASVNYRLSSVAPATGPLDPNRVKFPDHPHDVGEAIGWLHRHVARWGGDPTRMVLMGHSSGAHLASLVGVDPRYVRAYGVPRSTILGVVSLDTAAFSVVGIVSGEGARGGWSVFGTPEENAATGSWVRASPIRWADADDPPFLLVLQQKAKRNRVNQTRRFARALGLAGNALLQVPLNHAGINRTLGARPDPTLETSYVTRFVRETVAAARPVATIRAHPRKRLRAKGATVRVRFSFRIARTYQRVQCRRDGGRYRTCGSPFAYRVRPGRHVFSVRALAPSGAPGPADSFRFRVRPAA